MHTHIFFRSVTNPQGTVTLWQYLYGNCTYAGEDPSAGAAFNISVTRGGKPVKDVVVDGLGMIGEHTAATYVYDSCTWGGQPCLEQHRP